ncbi:MAG TPA: hemerythrin domain-containing protein [Dehalococcoidia bacterium]|nr:hemerythrin domain-containing protein [Dehalococcoidia bacterium]
MPTKQTKKSSTRSRATAKGSRSTTAKTRATASARARSTSTRSRATRATNSSQPEILNLLKKDHDEVKRMFKQFEKDVERSPQQAATVGHKILSELELHTKLEEAIVYPDLQRQDEDLYHEAEEEHHVADLLMKEVQGMNPGDPTYKAKMMVLRENVEHHIQEEENEMFKKIKKVEKARLDRMAEQWRSRKESGIPAGMMR